MRKYDRNAVFNIAIKGILFIAVFAGCFCLVRFVCGISYLLSALLAVIPAVVCVVLFSFLLRYTKFYYAYYSFVSGFLFRAEKENVYCPCCNKHFSQFSDERFYADDKHFNPESFSRSRQDVICDFCRSAPRQRIIAEWAEQNNDLLKSSKILCFAPELSMMLWFKRHGIKVKTADLYDKRADLKLDITALDLPSESEDIVFCNHVLEHVSDHLLALSELHRVIRKGGMLIISFPVDEGLDGMIEDKNASAEDRLRLCGQHDHLRLFGKDSMNMLENAGFEVSTIDISNMPDDIVPVTGPSDYDTNKVFYCIRN